MSFVFVGVQQSWILNNRDEHLRISKTQHSGMSPHCCARANGRKMINWATYGKMVDETYGLQMIAVANRIMKHPE
jgi:hypothetical protein